MSHEDYQLSINVPPSLEEAVVDCLLTIENARGFISFPVNGHHHSGQGLSLAEQVSGRQRRIRFQMNVDKQNIAELLNRLKTDFDGSGLHYWIMPVIEQGEI
ncbi:MAG: DUF3240 family protein [Methylococcales bacterium]|nr:DUF3240 family protein [Methylococcales bacterium]